MKQTRQLAIDGMTCQMCVRHVTKALSDLPGIGVKDVTVGSAVVEYDPADLPEDRIIGAVREAGYESRVTG